MFNPNDDKQAPLCLAIKKTSYEVNKNNIICFGVATKIHLQLSVKNDE